MRTLEGQLVVAGSARFVLVAARFNHFIVDRLVEGAIDAVVRHGGSADQITVVKVPGAWEIPLAVRAVAARADANLAIIALGAVIRGSTPHFDFVASEATKGIASVSLEKDVPVAFGILTTDSIEQAIERAGTKAGNKGWEAAVTAIEMLNLRAELNRAGY